MLTETPTNPLPSTSVQANVSGNTSGQRVFDDIHSPFTELAKTHQDQAAYLRAALRNITKSLRLLGFAMKGRVGATTLSDFARVEAVPENDVERLRYLLELEVQSCCGESSSFVSGPHDLGTSKISLITVSIPQTLGQRMIAAFSFAVPATTREYIELRCQQAQAYVSAAILHMPGAQAESSLAPNANAATSIDLVARAAQYQDMMEFVIALVNRLNAKYQCQQVALGLVDKHHLKVTAVSGLDTFKASNPGIVDLQQCMAEALDAGRTVAHCPDSYATNKDSLPVHRRLSDATSMAIASVPMFAGDDCVAVVTFKRSVQSGFSAVDLQELTSTVNAFGAALQLTRRADRSLKSHLLEFIQTQTKAAFVANSVLGLTIRAIVGAALLFFVLGWLPYRPTLRSKIVLANATQTLAPFEMRLESVHVRSGDRVKANQLLAQFDTRELSLQRDSLRSQIAQAEVDVRAALVAGNAALASVSKSLGTALRHQLTATETKIKHCTIIAPSDGMVVEDNLSDKVGQVFPQGTSVLTFSPMADFEIDMMVPESLARHVQPNQSGTFVAASDPTKRIPYRIKTVSGSAQMIDGQNVFVARARLDGKSEFFRQGVEGFAKTHTGWRPVPWIVLHRVYEYACERFWL